MQSGLHSLKKLLFLLSIIFFFTTSAHSQDFMMQGWYWDYPKTANGFSWADTLEAEAANLGSAGFTYMWLPPLSRASFGSGSNGYDPKDLFDLGIPSVGPTGFGTRPDVDAVISAFNAAGVNAVADVVYNHRDGGSAEDNPSVEGWIENFNCGKVDGGDNAYPSDRFRCYLPMGGSSGNGAGTYYFKLRSASLHPNYYNKEYKLYMETNTVGYKGLPEDNEDESGGGNGGGDCGQGNNTLQLGVDMIANVDDVGSCSGFCGIDEFQITIDASDFDAAGDTLWIYMVNPNGNYSDHHIIGLWDGSLDIQSQIGYQTYTDFTNLPSGRGGMNYTNFKPNGNPTQLNGDWDWMWFFYDYDQTVGSTTDTLNAWTKWLWDDVGIRGLRMDAVKHFDYAYTGDMLDYLHDNGIDPGMAVGEFFDFNAGTLKGWIDNVEANMDTDTKDAINIRAFDFALRQSLKDACDAFGYDARNVFNSGMVESAGANAYSVVTFVNNHDFRSVDEPVQNDPLLAYAYILTNNQVGLPCVFYPDYFQADVPNAPATYLRQEIDELIQAHKDYIFQSGSVDYLSRFSTPYSSNYTGGFDNTTLLYQLSGGIAGKEVIVAINFAGETLILDHEINMTNLSQGDELTDILGRSNEASTVIDGNNQMHIELPARSYSIWVNEDGLLPINLLAFDVIEKENMVSLEWQAEHSSNFSGFEIQKSLDGQHFERIDFIVENGTGIYQIHDHDIIFNKTMYYRLKMIDLDGISSFSNIQSAKLDRGISEAKFIPNPTSAVSVLNLNSGASVDGVLSITDLQGRLILTKQIRLEQGENNLEIKLNDFSSGLYFAELKTATTSTVLKLVKI